MKTKALFAGSFNPFTAGHRSIVERALRLCDEVIIGIGVNIDKEKERSKAGVEMIENIYKDNPRVSVYEYQGLTVDFAKEHGVTCLVRGVRNTDDFVKEKELAQVNHQLSGLETILLVAETHLENLSSSMVRELQKYGKDISDFL